MVLRDCFQKHSDFVIYCLLCCKTGKNSLHCLPRRGQRPPTFRTCSRFSSLARGRCDSLTARSRSLVTGRASGWAGHALPSPAGGREGDKVTTHLGSRASASSLGPGPSTSVCDSAPPSSSVSDLPAGALVLRGPHLTEGWPISTRRPFHPTHLLRSLSDWLRPGQSVQSHALGM